METTAISLASEAKAEKILKAPTLETSTEAFNGNSVSIQVRTMQRSVGLSTQGVVAGLEYDDRSELTGKEIGEIIGAHDHFLITAEMLLEKTQDTFVALLEREESLKAECVEDRKAIYLMTRLHHGLEQLLKLRSPFNYYEKDIQKDTVAVALLQRSLVEIDKQHTRYQEILAAVDPAPELEELMRFMKKIIRTLTELIDTMVLSQRSKSRHFDLLKSAR